MLNMTIRNEADVVASSIKTIDTAFVTVAICENADPPATGLVFFAYGLLLSPAAFISMTRHLFEFDKLSNFDSKQVTWNGVRQEIIQSELDG
uniref:SSD domain-containing protein n=1 Tax=Angiostrongylus cantonensis TaxID=6313 RepID=A0A0K0D5Z4_ANGCA